MDKLQQLYNTLSQNRSVKGLPSSYDAFRTAMQDEATAQKFHAALASNRAVKGIPTDYAAFADGLGLKKKVESEVSESVSPTIAQDSPLGGVPVQGGEPTQTQYGVVGTDAPGSASGESIRQQPEWSTPTVEQAGVAKAQAEANNFFQQANEPQQYSEIYTGESGAYQPVVTDASGSVSGEIDKTPESGGLPGYATGAAKGLTQPAGDMLKGMAKAAYDLNLGGEYDDKQLEELGLHQLGEAINGLIPDWATPEQKETFLYQTANGLGQAGGFSAMALTGNFAGLSATATVALSGAMVNGINEYEQAKAAGATDEQANKAFYYNSIVGTTEALPIMNALARLDKFTGGYAGRVFVDALKDKVGGRIASDVLAGSFEEAIQEGGSKIAANIIAQNTYDQGRDLFDGVIDAMAAGAVTGSVLSGATSTLREYAAKETTTPEQKVKAETLAAELEKKAVEIDPVKSNLTPGTEIGNGVTVVAADEKGNYDVQTPVGEVKGLDAPYLQTLRQVFAQPAPADIKAEVKAIDTEIKQLEKDRTEAYYQAEPTHEQEAKRTPEAKQKAKVSLAKKKDKIDAKIDKKIDALEAEKKELVQNPPVVQETKTSVKVEQPVTNLQESNLPNSKPDAAQAQENTNQNTSLSQTQNVQEKRKEEGLPSGRRGNNNLGLTPPVEKEAPTVAPQSGDTVTIRSKHDAAKQINYVFKDGKWQFPSESRYAKEGYEVASPKEQETVTRQWQNTNGNFQVTQPQSEKQQQVQAAIQQAIDSGTTNLDQIKAEVAATVGDSPDIMNAVEDAYHDVGRSTARNETEKQAALGVIGQVNKFINKLFGGKAFVLNSDSFAKRLEETLNGWLQTDGLKLSTPEDIQRVIDMLPDTEQAQQTKIFLQQMQQMVEKAGSIEALDASITEQEKLDWEEDWFIKTKGMTKEQFRNRPGAMTKEEYDAVEQGAKAKLNQEAIKKETLGDKVDKLNKLPPGMKFMRKPDGTVYGFTDGKNVYINTDKLNANTPVHEASHVWLDWLKQNGDPLYKKGLALVKDSRYFRKVSANPAYQKLTDGLSEKAKEEYLLNEALATAIGDKGAQFLTESKKQSWKEWAAALWKKLGDAAGFKNIKPSEIQNLTLEEFTARAAKDILEGEPQASEPAPLSGTKHAATDAKREEFGMAADEKMPTTLDAIKDEADKRLADDADIQRVLDKALVNGDVLDAADHEILGRYIAGKEAELRMLNDNLTAAAKSGDQVKMEALQPARQKTFNELDEAYRAAKTTGSEWGLAGRQRQEMLREDFSLTNLFLQKSKANKGAKLTAKQVDEVLQLFADIQEAQGALDARLQALEEKQVNQQASDNVKSQRAQSTRQKKTKEQILKERAEAKEKLKQLKAEQDKFREDNNLQAKGIADGRFVMTSAMAKEIAKIVRSYVEEGIVKLDEVVAKVHADVKEYFTDIKEYDVRDVIAGKYAEKKEPLSDLNKQLRELQIEQRLLDKLADLEAAAPKQSEQKQRATNKQIADLRAKLKSAQRGSLEAHKARVRKQIDKISERIEAGDFSKAEKPVIMLDAEAIKLKQQLRDLKHSWNVQLKKDELANRTKTEKAKDLFVDVINVPRSLMASLDFSMPLRQAAMFTISHPVIAAKAMGEMFSQAFSQRRFEAFLQELKNTPEYNLMEESGLYISDPDALHLSAREEQFMSNLAERIPVWGVLVKGSQRAAIAYLNKMRADLFNQGATQFEKDGLTPEEHPELYKAWAHYINNGTGRGKLGILEQSAPVLNSVFFSPRFMASRLNTLLAPLTYANAPAPVREQAIKDWTSFVGFTMVVLGLLALSGGDEAEVGDDPLSSDFGKLKIGNTRWDLWGGYQQWATYIMRSAAFFVEYGKMLNGDTSAKKFVKETYNQTSADTDARFFSGKMAPIPGFVYELKHGKDRNGKPMDADKIQEKAIDMVIPMYWGDTWQAMQEDGGKAALTVGIPSIFGVGVQVYDKDSKK